MSRAGREGAAAASRRSKALCLSPAYSRQAGRPAPLPIAGVAAGGPSVGALGLSHAATEGALLPQPQLSFPTPPPQAPSQQCAAPCACACACLAGGEEEFLFVGRLDNLAMSYCSLQALLDACAEPGSLDGGRAERGLLAVLCALPGWQVLLCYAAPAASLSWWEQAGPGPLAADPRSCTHRAVIDRHTLPALTCPTCPAPGCALRACRGGGGAGGGAVRQ